MNSVLSYFKESYLELTTNVTWPAWNIVQKSAVAVLVATIIIALVIFLMDTVSKFGVEKIYQLG